jgi:hypothetical protein
MRHMFSTIPLFVVACGGADDLVPGPSDIAAISLEQAIPANLAEGIEGITVDILTENFFVLNRTIGLIEIDKNGEVVNTYRTGEDGLDTSAATDVARFYDGRFLLATNGDVLLWDPVQKIQVSFFCLVPAIEDSWLENGAVTVHGSSGRIFAAPAYYENGGQGPQTAFHVTYAAFDGEFIGQVDVRQSGFIAHGLAFEAAKDRVLAVEKDRLGIFSPEGELIRTLPLDIEQASGLTINVALDRGYVSQRGKREIFVFALSEL